MAGSPFWWRSVVRVAAPSDHERGREEDLLVLGVAVDELVDEQPHDVLTGHVEGLADTRQRDGGKGGGRGVVEAGDGDVAAGNQAS